MPISKEEAREIAKAFLDISHELGTYRFANWADLSSLRRRQIEDSEWDLLNYSGSFLSTAVGIALDDLEHDLNAIQTATAQARQAIRQAQSVKDVVKLATNLVILGGAIAARNPSAIKLAARDLAKLTKSLKSTT